MWRIGHNYAGQKTNKSKNETGLLKSRRSIQETPKAQKSDRKNSKFSDSMVDPKSKRPSLLAFKHLIRRRSTRGFIDEDLYIDDASHGQYCRRSSRTNEMKKMREIQAKINKVVSDYDSYITEDTPANDDLLQDIEDGLGNVENDMLRINITALIAKHRKLQRYMRTDYDGMQETVDQYDDKVDALQSLQDWLDKDHFESVESEEIDLTYLQISDNEKIQADLHRVKQKMKSLGEIQRKIRQLKESGSDTYFLERQRENLHQQMKSEVRRLQKDQSQHSDGNTSAADREFNYIKNAATEIYDLLQRTKIEGMAQSHEFEGQLKKILKEMEDAKLEISSLQDLVCSQRDQITKWSKDYEKLHNELLMTTDERNATRDDNRQLRLELYEYKQSIKKLRSENSSDEFIATAEHNDIVNDLETSLKSAKQKLTVMSKALDEKGKINADLAHQCYRLKYSLRKQSSAQSLSSEISLHSSLPDLTTKLQHQANVLRNESSRTLYSSTNSLTHENPDIIISNLKEEIENLREKLQKALENEKKNDDEFHDRNKIVAVPSKSENPQRQLLSKITQTHTAADTVMVTAYDEDVVDPLFIKRMHYASASCQTDAPVIFSNMTPHERFHLYQTCQVLMDKLGGDWVDIALKLSALNPDEIRELHKGIALESDIKRIYSGSPTTSLSPQSDPSTTNIQTETTTEKINQGEYHEEIDAGYDDNAPDFHSQLEQITAMVSSHLSDVRNVMNNQAEMMNTENYQVQEGISRHSNNTENTNLDEQTEYPINESTRTITLKPHIRKWKKTDSLEPVEREWKKIDNSTLDKQEGKINHSIESDDHEWERIDTSEADNSDWKRKISLEPLDHPLQPLDHSHHHQSLDHKLNNTHFRRLENLEIRETEPSELDNYEMERNNYEEPESSESTQADLEEGDQRRWIAGESLEPVQDYLDNAEIPDDVNREWKVTNRQESINRQERKAYSTQPATTETNTANPRGTTNRDWRKMHSREPINSEQKKMDFREVNNLGRKRKYTLHINNEDWQCTDLMEKVSDEIRKIEAREQSNHEGKKAHPMDSASLERKKIEALEQANRKIGLIEETMLNLLKETKKIYAKEIDTNSRTNRGLRDILKDTTANHVSHNAKTLKSKIRALKAADTTGRSTALLHPNSPTPLSLSSRSRPSNTLAEASHFHEGGDDAVQGAERVLSGHLWTYGSKSSIDQQRNDSFSMSSADKPLPFSRYHDTNSRDVTTQAVRPGLTDGLQNKIRRGKARTGSFGLVIQPTSTPKDLTLVSSPIGRKPPTTTNTALTSQGGRAGRSRNFTLLDIHSNMYDRRFQNLVRSAGLQSVGDLGAQSIKALPNGGKKKNTKYRRNFNHVKLPFILKS